LHKSIDIAANYLVVPLADKDSLHHQRPSSEYTSQFVLRLFLSGRFKQTSLVSTCLLCENISCFQRFIQETLKTTIMFSVFPVELLNRQSNIFTHTILFSGSIFIATLINSLSKNGTLASRPQAKVDLLALWQSYWCSALICI